MQYRGITAKAVLLHFTDIIIGHNVKINVLIYQKSAMVLLNCLPNMYILHAISHVVHAFILTYTSSIIR